MSGVVSFVGASPSTGPTNGGKTYAWNILTNMSIVVAPANPSRRSIIFHNPGTVNIYVSMPLQMFLDGTQGILDPNIIEPGGGFLLAPGQTLSFMGGEIQTAWQASSASGTNNALTVMDSNS